MKEWIKNNLGLKAWGLFGFTTVMALWGWASLGTDVGNLYRLFPLFGLIAFSTMWGHYMVWGLKEWSGASPEKIQTYSKVTHWVVFVSLLLHPALLVYQLNADGLGKPPESYEAYVGQALMGFVALGTVCLLAFLAFELKKWLKKVPTLWKVVLGLNHLAMLGIVIHSIQLGNSVKQFPLNILWPTYGLTLMIVYGYLGYKKKLFSS